MRTKLSFLDVTITREEDALTTTTFERKPSMLHLSTNWL